MNGIRSGDDVCIFNVRALVRVLRTNKKAVCHQTYIVYCFYKYSNQTTFDSYQHRRCRRRRYDYCIFTRIARRLTLSPRALLPRGRIHLTLRSIIVIYCRTLIFFSADVRNYYRPARDKRYTPNRIGIVIAGAGQ